MQFGSANPVNVEMESVELLCGSMRLPTMRSAQAFKFCENEQDKLIHTVTVAT